MRTAMLKSLVSAAALLACPGATTAAAAQSATPNALTAFLDKKYGKPSRPFGFLNKIVPPPADAEPTAVSVEGKRPDGSYWFSAVFSGNNVRMFSEPRNALTKFCAHGGGTLSLVKPYVLFGGAVVGTATLTDAETGRTLEVTPQFMADWARSGAGVEPIIERRRGYKDIDDATIHAIQRRDALGLFSCAAAGAPRWHVAILPTETGKLNNEKVYYSDSLENSWIALSVRPIDAAVIEPTLAAVKADEVYREQLKRAGARAVAKYEAGKAVEDSRRAAAVAAFRRTLTVGSRTNCGMVLAFKDPLVEVQPGLSESGSLAVGPPGIARIFVRRTRLFPEETGAQCDYR